MAGAWLKYSSQRCPHPIFLARRYCLGERKWTVSNHVLHDEGGDQTLDVRKPGQLLIVEPLKRRKIGGHHHQHVVRIAKQSLCLDDGRNNRQRRFKLSDCLLMPLSQRHEHDGREIQPEPRCGELRTVALDVSRSVGAIEGSFAGSGLIQFLLCSRYSSTQNWRLSMKPISADSYWR